MFTKYLSKQPPGSHLNRAVHVLAGGAIALSMLGVSAPASAQTVEQKFAAADWFEREIGDGVIWRSYMFDDLFGVRQHISYIEIDLDNPAVEIEVPYLANGTQRTSVMVPGQFPDALGAVNGTYFASGGHNTYLRVGGTTIPHEPRSKGLWGHHAGLILDDTGDWLIDFIPGPGVDDWNLDTTSDTIVGNGPMLVWNGAVDTASTALPGGSHCSGRNPRTAAGITADNRLILLTIDGRTVFSTGTTCDETAEVLLALDVEQAVNMDGGGSTTMYIKDEPASGVVNYPSDGTGERAAANAIAVVSNPAAPAAWDGQLLSISYQSVVEPEESQTVTLVYENIGTETWTAADTRLITSRPAERTSDLFASSTGWVSDSQPALMTPATVESGEQATFSFNVTAPDTLSVLSYEEFFMLDQDGIGRIGPPDSRARLEIVVVPATPTGDSFIVESRGPNGQNFQWYTDDPGFADSSATNNAPGTTATGTRWTSTFTSVVGVREATWRPDFAEGGEYAVAVSWPDAGSNRRNPVTYHVDHSGGRSSVDIDQTAEGDIWYPLGVFTFNAGESSSGQVIMTNANTDQSGNMWAGAVRFTLIEDPSSSVNAWSLY